MRFFISILFLLLFVSCKEKKVVLQEDFIFSYSGINKIISLKFVNDTVFVAENYPDNYYVYYFLLEESEKVKVNSFLDSLQFKKFKDEYVQENIVDAGSYQFEIANIPKSIYVYGFYGDYDFYDNYVSYEHFGFYEHNQLKKLNEFADLITNFYESKINWDLNNKVYYRREVYWKSDVDFGSVERFIEPEPEPFPIDDYVQD